METSEISSNHLQCQAKIVNQNQGGSVAEIFANFKDQRTQKLYSPLYLHLIHQSDPGRTWWILKNAMDYCKDNQVAATATAVADLVSFLEQINVATARAHGVCPLIWWMHSFQF